MDDFLEKTIKKINGMKDEEINELKQDFERVMKLTYDFFGDRNFRLPTDSTRGRINIALLESVSYFFSQKSDVFLQKYKNKILAKYEELLNDADFVDAIGSTTSDRRRVITRFKLVQKILGNTQC